MKAISTKYIGPSNTRGSRVTAYDSDGNRVTLPYDSALNSEPNHRKAAEALRDKMGWAGNLVSGSTREGYVFVFAD